jgi:hypothetical protein
MISGTLLVKSKNKYFEDSNLRLSVEKNFLPIVNQPLAFAIVMQSR